jgi:hypothetical protein
MKQLQILCLAIALMTCSVSMVVYGQMSDSNKNSCLVIGLRDVTKPLPSRSNIKDPKLRQIQEFLDSNNIPLEISYVKTTEQYEVPDAFFSFLNIGKQPETQNSEKFEAIKEDSQIEQVAPAVEIEPAVQVLSQYNKPQRREHRIILTKAETTIPVSSENIVSATSTNTEQESIERPTLRTPGS